MLSFSQSLYSVATCRAVGLRQCLEYTLLGKKNGEKEKKNAINAQSPPDSLRQVSTEQSTKVGGGDCSSSARVIMPTLSTLLLKREGHDTSWSKCVLELKLRNATTATDGMHTLTTSLPFT